MERPPTCIIPQLQNNVTKYLTKDGLHLRRRNVAYLAAVARGARQILDADCKSFTPNALRVLGFQSTNARGLMYNTTRHFNPYAHFGAWSAVPRALYDSSGVVARNSRLYYVRDFSRVYVKHGLSEESEDIVWLDTAEGKSTTCRFDHSAPPVYIGQRTFSPVVSSCAVYHQRAFWGLLLPCTSNVLRCFVLRQYVLQRMLRELDAFSGLYQVLNTLALAATDTMNSTGGCMHKGVNTASGLRDSSFSSTVDLDVVKLASFLDSWLCKPNMTLFKCLAGLFDNLRSEGFLKDVDLKLVKSWVTSLQTLGVPEPPRVSAPWRGVRKITEVPVLLGNVRASLEHGGRAAEKTLDKNLLDPVRSQCNGAAARAVFPSVAQWYHPVVTDIVLIITFNHNKFLWKNLPYLETIHRPFFKHIVYCIPNVTEVMTDKEGRRLEHVTFVEGFSEEWYLMYECLANVAIMDIQGVRGYLHIGDDTLLNTWLLFNASRDVMWLPRGFTNVAVDESKHRWGWYFWNKPQGRPAVLHTLSDLERLSGMTSEQIIKLDPTKRTPKSPKSRTFSEIFQSDNSSLVRFFTNNSSARQIKLKQKWAGSLTEPTNQEAAQFLNNYIRVNRLMGHAIHRAIDLFYVPHVLREKYVTFARYFLRHGVIIELAVPTIHYGLTRRGEVSYVRANSLWNGNRNITRTFYDKSIFFLHPFKMHGNMAVEDGRAFFCDVYAQTLFSKLP